MKKERAPQGIIVLVDVLLFSLVDDKLCLLTHRRENEPFKGELALPGGYIRPNEDLSAIDAAKRVLKSKAGAAAPYLEQLGTYSGPDRDPGGWSLSIAYFALAHQESLAMEGDSGIWKPVKRSMKLAFDHNTMLAHALDRIRTRSAYSILPAFLAGPKFTLPQLQKVYEEVLGTDIDAVSFRRRMDEMGAVEPIKGEKVTGLATRPAQLYQLKVSARDPIRQSTLTRGFGSR